MSTAEVTTPFEKANRVHMVVESNVVVDDGNVLLTTYSCDNHPDFWAEQATMRSDSYYVGLLAHNTLPPFCDTFDVMRDNEGCLWFVHGLSMHMVVQSALDELIDRRVFTTRPLEWQGLADRLLGQPHCWVREVMARRGIDQCVVPVYKNQPELPDFIMSKLQATTLTDRSDKLDVLVVKGNGA